MAGGLRILVEGNALDDQSIDGLISIVENAINSVDDELDKEKLEKSKTFLQKLKETELQSQQQDEKDIQQLNELLAAV